MIVAIDGPSGAGKSSVAKAVASVLRFSCLDTGAMYRAIAWKALQNDMDLQDEMALTSLASSSEITFGHNPGDPMPRQVYIDGEDITDAIRTAEIDKAVSPVSATAGVRKALVAQQQRIGSQGNYVVEGRDIGTAVFPNAAVKIFLTASSEERAHRRVRQNADRGVGSINYEEVLADIKRRDEVDSTRAASPLKPADDAIMLESTQLHIEDVIGMICDYARQAMANQEACEE